MTLPYATATSGQKTIGEIQKVLQEFGASSFGFMEDFSTGDLIVQFKWKERAVTVRASAKGYAVAWLKHHPYGSRTRGTKAQHEEKALKQAKISVYSILRDWIKGQITAVETGMMSFEGAFLGQLHLPNGETVMDRLASSGILQIEDQRG